MSHLEEDFLFQLKVCGLPRPDKREFMFAKEAMNRRWRSDFAYTKNDLKLLIEIEGGEYIEGGGRHNRNLAKDATKYNACVLLGYRLLRFTGSMLKSGEAMETMRKVLE